MLKYILPLLFLATPVFAGTYDGTWKYEMFSQSASPVCHGFANGSFKVENHKFSDHLAHPADSFRVKGELDDQGNTEFMARGGYETATFVVSFAKGDGTWTSRDCKGTIKLAR